MQRILSRRLIPSGRLVAIRSVSRIQSRGFSRLPSLLTSVEDRWNVYNAACARSDLQNRHLSSLSSDPNNPSSFEKDDEIEDSHGIVNSKEETVNEYQFRYDLNRWYRETHDISLNDAFVTESLTLSSEDDHTVSHVWTSTFICPVTGDRVESGKLPLEARIKQNNRWYYSKKKLAQTAAAKQALKRYRLTYDTPNVFVPEHSQLQAFYMKNHKVCVTDEMFTPTKEVRSRTTWWTASFTCPVSGEIIHAKELQDGDEVDGNSERYLYRNKRDAFRAVAAQALEVMSLENDKSESDPIDSSPEPPVRSRLARQHLQSRYEEKHNINLSEEDFVVSSIVLKGSLGGIWWTASFICPLSGDRYDSGALTQFAMHTDDDGINWYRKKEHSIVAASFNALDELRLNDKNNDDSELCQEQPLAANTADHAEKTQTIKVDVAIGVDQLVEEDEEDEFVIKVVPQRFGNTMGSGSSTATTLDLIAQTWLEFTEPVHSDDKKSPKFHGASSERNFVVDRASAWVMEQLGRRQDRPGDRTQFDNVGQMNNQKLANLILNSLASSHQRLPSNKVSYGVEDAANAVLNFMWSTPSTSPDAASYAAYLKCLEGDDPMKVAKRARRIFDSMSNGTAYDGRVLPKPTIAVYNSLLQRLAEAGIKEFQIDQISGIIPDRQTYLSLLSSNAYSTGYGDGIGFDADYASKIIDSMSNSNESNDSSLKADIDVYNASLRWSAGLNSTLSRPYTKPMPWDNYHEIYKEGFIKMDDNNSLVKEASAIEDWFNSIVDGKYGNNVQPNIETYESLIQAWTRTGTIEGLQRAEALAELLIQDQNKDIELRLQTIHPILASWAYSGNSEGSARVGYWLKQLEGSVPEFELDGRLRVVGLIARVAYQKRLLEGNALKSKGGAQSQSSSALSNAAKALEQVAIESSQILQTMIDDFKQRSDFFFECDPFLLTIQASRNAGLVGSRQGHTHKTDAAMSAIEQTVQEFDNLVGFLYARSNEDDLRQIQYLMQHSNHVYFAALCAINEFDRSEHQQRLKDSIKRNSRFLNQLHTFEEKIRRSEEFRIYIEEFGKSGGEDDPTYEDLFFYPGESLLDSSTNASQLRFYDTLVETLEHCELSPNRNPDVIRICILITEILKAKRNTLSSEEKKIYESMIRVLCKDQMKSSNRDVLVGGVIHDIDELLQRHSGKLENTESTPPKTETSRDVPRSEKEDRSSFTGKRLRRRRRPRRSQARETQKNTHKRRMPQSRSKKQSTLKN